MFNTGVKWVPSLAALLAVGFFGAQARADCPRNVEQRLQAAGCKKVDASTARGCCTLSAEVAREACVTARVAECVDAADKEMNYKDLSAPEYLILRGLKFSTEVGRGKNDVLSGFNDGAAPKLESDEHQSWGLDFGYSDKSILRDILNVVEEVCDKACDWKSGSGTPAGDIFIDPFKLTATIGIGDVFKSNVEDPPNSMMFKDKFEEEEQWEVAIKYELPVEHLYGHLVRGMLAPGVRRDGDRWMIPKE